MLAVTILEVFGIIGVIVLCLMLAVVGFVAYHIWRFKRALKQLGASFQGLGEVMKQGVVPSSLGLTPLDDDALEERPEVLAIVQSFKALGLRRGGVYTSSFMPGSMVVTLADPNRAVTAAVTSVSEFGAEHGIDVTYDVVTLFEDGGALTHRTLKSLGIDYPPQFAQVVVPDASVPELLAKHLSDRDEQRVARRIEPEDVAEEMEAYNAEVARWRDQRGGLSEHEVRANLRAFGTEAEDASIAMLLAVSRAEAERRERDEYRESFLAASGWTAQQWEDHGHGVLIVTDDTSAEQLLEEITEKLDLPLTDAEAVELRERAASTSSRAAAAEWAKNYRSGEGVQRLASWDTPTPGDAYVARR